MSSEVAPAEQTEVRRLASECERSVEIVSSADMTQRAGTNEHQGFMLRMPDFPYTSYDDFWANLTANPGLLLSAGIQDPHNLGAVIRSAEVFGVDALLVPETGQAPVSAHVVRSSAGAANYLPIVQCESIVEAARRLQQQGVRVLGASERATKTIGEADLTSGVGVMIGNEGRGLSDEIIDVCDQLVAIPQVGRVGSLNAAVAASIICYEMCRQRGTSNRQR